MESQKLSEININWYTRTTFEFQTKNKPLFSINYRLGMKPFKAKPFFRRKRKCKRIHFPFKRSPSPIQTKLPFQIQKTSLQWPILTQHHSNGFAEMQVVEKSISYWHQSVSPLDSLYALSYTNYSIIGFSYNFSLFINRFEQLKRLLRDSAMTVVNMTTTLFTIDNLRYTDLRRLQYNMSEVRAIVQRSIQALEAIASVKDVICYLPQSSAITDWIAVICEPLNSIAALDTKVDNDDQNYFMKYFHSVLHIVGCNCEYTSLTSATLRNIRNALNHKIQLVECEETITAYEISEASIELSDTIELIKESIKIYANDTLIIGKILAAKRPVSDELIEKLKKCVSVTYELVVCDETLDQIECDLIIVRTCPSNANEQHLWYAIRRVIDVMSKLKDVKQSRPDIDVTEVL